MLFYETEYYQVHILQDKEAGETRPYYKIVNKLTTIVEGSHEVLPNALSLADAYTGAFDSFLKTAKGKFNPDMQNNGVMNVENTSSTDRETDESPTSFD